MAENSLDESVEHLVVLDTTGIHDFVFSSNELRQMRGASSLLARITTREWKRVLAAEGGRVVFCAGGNAMAIFGDQHRAEAGAAEAVRLLHQEGAHAAFHVEPRRTGESENSWRNRALARLEAAKQQATQQESPEFNPYGRFCDSCGIRPAETRSIIGPRRLVCRSCRSRIQRSGYWFRRFRKHIPEASAGKLGLVRPTDLSVLGEHASPPGYVAYIYLDANRMGERFRDLGFAAYTALSKAVDSSTTSAVFRALRDTCLVRRPRLQDNAVSLACFEIFLLGGDDAVLALPADRALPFLSAFISHFERRFQKVAQSEAPSFSAGVVFARSHYPVFLAVRHAEELLRSCKTRAYKANLRDHMIDYMTITSPLELPASELRQQRFPAGRNVIERPLTWKELKLVRELCGILQQLPRKKQHRLFDALGSGRFQAVVDYLVWISRLPPETRKKLSEFSKNNKLRLYPSVDEWQIPYIEALELIDYGGEA